VARAPTLVAPAVVPPATAATVLSLRSVYGL